MTKLATLHHRLATLRRRRRLVRVGAGLAAVGIALLWGLIALFLVDWLLHMTQAQRGLAMAIAAGGVVWALRRYAWPWLSYRETELDVALLVERQHQIDSDLVAALQFERPEAREWGSPQLEDQVIDYTADIGTRLDVRHDVPRKDLNRRAMMLAAMAVLFAGLMWLFPEYAVVFFNRLLLGNRHYPTRTTIETVAINGHAVDLTARRLQVITCPYGQPVRFEATCSGELPATGHATLRAERGGLQTTVSLESTAQKQGLYLGLLPRLVDTVSYQLYLGDAWTPTGRLLVVPLPMIDVQMEITPPDYARNGDKPAQTTGLRHISVIEGSRVVVRMTSDASLREATFSIDDKPYAMACDASAPSKPGEDRWILDPANTPLDNVAEPIRYTIQVTDSHDLQLERPIQGVIRIQPDLKPRVVGSMVTRHVLPTARPTITYNASDDYGLARLAILPEVVHADGTTEPRGEIVIYQSPKGQTPQKELKDRFRIDLTPLEAVKGDQVKLTLQAVDFRGKRPGGETASEPLVLEVTDEQGILAAMAETDRESARQLQTMIERQIDVGGKP
jgi:hypothetical protein